MGTGHLSLICAPYRPWLLRAHRSPCQAGLGRSSGTRPLRARSCRSSRRPI